MVKMMAEYQLGKQLTDEETASILTFLKALKGEIPTDYVKAPKLPEGTADTPKA
jgi:cytochrome c peroxidase